MAWFGRHMGYAAQGLLFLAMTPALAFGNCGSSIYTPPAPDTPVIVQTEPQKQAVDCQRSWFRQLLLNATRQRGLVEGLTAPPLSSKQKFELFSRTAVDPYHFVAVGFDAGFSQATDGFHGYGQGMAGLGKRYGASLADDLSSRFFGDFAYPSLFKEDPRYFRMGTGPIPKRIFYAVLQEFVAHTDQGGRRFNFSHPLGAITAGAIANAYYPSSDRGVGLTFERAGVSLLIGSANQVLKEFWPDIRRKLLQGKPNPGCPEPSRLPAP